MLFTLDNTYLDSPESIAVLMAAMASAGAGPFVLTADTNSAALRGDELAPTTSYLVGYYPAAAGSARTSGLHRDRGARQYGFVSEFEKPGATRPI